MTSSIAASSAYATAAFQYAETAELLNSESVNTGGNTIDPNGFLIPVLPPALEEALEATTTVNNNAEIGTEGLLSIDTPTLSLFNEVATTDPENVGITGTLSAQQLQDIALLQQDALMLDAAATVNSNVSLVENGTTLDLSVEAQNIIAANINAINAAQTTNIAANTNLQTNTDLALTQAQLVQLNQILAPFANQPLTAPVLEQIQDQLAANQINPLALSLSTLLLMQNYVAGLSPVMIETLTKDLDNNDDDMVKAVEAADSVAVEDSAIPSS